MFYITVHFSISGTTLHAMQELEFHTCSVEQEAWHKNLWHSCTQKEEEKLLLMCGSPIRDILFKDGEDDPGLLLWINKASAVSMWVPCQAWSQACSFAFLLRYCKVSSSAQRLNVKEQPCWGRFSWDMGLNQLSGIFQKPCVRLEFPMLSFTNAFLHEGMIRKGHLEYLKSRVLQNVAA